VLPLDFGLKKLPMPKLEITKNIVIKEEKKNIFFFDILDLFLKNCSMYFQDKYDKINEIKIIIDF
tara:strand:+ start:1560 stop:1754 length:195 start_codon:yes stop_codon:yes gene_type:complete